MAYKKITNIILRRFYINIFFLIGFILAGIKLEDYFYESEGYYLDLVPGNIELVINEQADAELILSDLDYEHESLANNTECVNSFQLHLFPTILFAPILILFFRRRASGMHPPLKNQIQYNVLHSIVAML